MSKFDDHESKDEIDEIKESLEDQHSGYGMALQHALTCWWRPEMVD